MFENLLAGMAGPNIEGQGQIINALGQNALMPHPQEPQRRKGGGLGDILGAIGDALLVANGRAPLYAQSKRQRQQEEHEQQINAALANYLDNPEAAIRALLPIDAGMAIQLANSNKKAEPQEIDLMRRVGIDPNSEQGRQIITRKLSGAGQSDPNFVRELEALGIDPHSDEARTLYYGRNSPAGYLLTPKGRPQGGSGPPPGTVVKGYRFKGGNPNDKANWEPAGGPTPQASGNFPR